MAIYEYLCLACEHLFEERRPMEAGSVTTALGCPSCGSDRVRRRFSMFATGGAAGSVPGSGPRSGQGSAPRSGGCCGGGCACGG